MELIGIMIVVFVLLVLFIANALQKKREAAKNAYEVALSQFRQEPTSPSLRQTALQAGRYYSNLTRNSNGVTVYDEVAIKNDLDAAGAGAYEQLKPSIVTAPNAQKPTVAERLATLDQLQAQGLVSDDEFRDRRVAIIQSI